MSANSPRNAGTKGKQNSQNIRVKQSSDPNQSIGSQNSSNSCSATKQKISNAAGQSSPSKAPVKSLSSENFVQGKALHPIRSDVCSTGNQSHDSAVTGERVRMTNVPTEARSESWAVHEHRDMIAFSPEEILQNTGETDFEKVYNIELHAVRLAKIQNLEKFTSVRTLDLSSNYIRQIEKLTENKELRELKLYGNEILRIENLDGLKQLQNLHLQHNRIQTIGKGLKGVTKLKFLRLDFNRLSRLDANDLSCCVHLTSLDVSYNQLDCISAVNCLSNLEELYAHHNLLKTITDLSRCKQLHELDVSSNPLTDLTGLQRCSNLRILNTSNCPVKSVSSLGTLENLEELNMSYCRLTELGTIAKSFPGLHMLDVTGNSISSPDELDNLSTLTALVEISLADNPFCVSSDGCTKQPIISYLPALKKMLPSLTLLNSVPVSESNIWSNFSDSVICPVHGVSHSVQSTSSVSLASGFMSDRPASACQHRPRTAGGQDDSKGVVDDQFTAMQSQLIDMGDEISSQFASLRMSITSLVEGTQREESDQNDLPTSKLRKRLQDAQAFACTSSTPSKS